MKVIRVSSFNEKDFVPLLLWLVNDIGNFSPILHEVLHHIRLVPLEWQIELLQLSEKYKLSTLVIVTSIYTGPYIQDSSYIEHTV